MTIRDFLGFAKIYGSIAIGVKDVDRAVAWYCNSFRFSSEPTYTGEVYVGYAVGDGDVRRTILLVPISEGRTHAAVGQHPVLFTRDLKKVHEELVSKGVVASPIQQDSGGNQFFQFQDSEGNNVEMCLEPGLKLGS